VKKRLIRKSVVLITLYACLSFPIYPQENEECTIGAASGRATADGRPLVWKTRDTSEINNEVAYITSYKYKFVAVTNAGVTAPWMGVNEKGFAILNSKSSDLPSGSSGMVNESLMGFALGNCITVEEFERILDSTNVSGRQTHGNFGVIDSTGGAAIFETAGYEYWKFDANDSTVAPDGYVLRTNFAFNGDAKNGLNDGIYSIERYRRTTKLIGDFYVSGSLSYKSILRTQMRDFSDSYSNPIPIPYPRKWQSNRPYGYIRCDFSICRSTSVSAAVIQGVSPHETAKLSTMWTMLGQPASSIVVPYWPVGTTPKEAHGNSTALLCDIANQIREQLFDYAENTNYIDSYKLLDGNGGGLWTKTFPAEDSIFSIAKTKLTQWRNGTFSVQEMLETETDLAQFALNTLQNAYDGMITAVAQEHSNSIPIQFSLYQNYPNPFNATTTIGFYLAESCHITLKIFNPIGQEVTTLISRTIMPGNYQTEWDASNFADGSYFYQFQAQSINKMQDFIFSDVKKLILIK
jgi:hypothetical protein